MRRLPLLAAVAACVLVSGCASSSQLGERALGNLEFCERSYTAMIGGFGNNSGSLNIRCPAKPFAPAVPMVAEAE
ncbi:hypothetical protein [Phenylobacterium deserti]|uniref:hypothetical protein n=1 Tax=Phenylobacterium deserti TaxID=1914756 RepID=UPI001057F560|nr:hypothetical protein [Phenylobacterium deserti]